MQSIEPAVFRDGWDHAIAGQPEITCPYPPGAHRDAWLQGYEDAIAERSKEPSAVPAVLIRIVAPHFVAGLEARDGRVIRSAPIIKYMRGWTGQQVAAYCTKKHWTWQRLSG